MDKVLEQFVEELTAGIQESVGGSEQIADTIAKINARGYNVRLVLRATIAIQGAAEEPISSPVQSNSAVRSMFSREDIRFLKSLNITVNG